MRIKVDHLSKYYKDHLVIRDLSLEIGEGEIAVFQGPSGVGKSTFLRCLTYLEPFQKGAVELGTNRLEANLNEKKARGLIRSARTEAGRVFQFFDLFPHLTVLENLTLGPREVLGAPEKEARERAMGLLRRVGLEEKAAAWPGTLSGGQRQRVAIARALAMNPKAMLFDEPTSSLDPEMKEEVAGVIEDFARDGLTMLIVTHEPRFAERIATRVVSFGPECSVLSDKAR